MPSLVEIDPVKPRQGPSVEQTWVPFTKGCFVSSLVEIGLEVLEKKIIKFCQCIFSILNLFHNYLSLEKGSGSLEDF